MSEIRRFLNKRTIYMIIIALFLCVLVFVVTGVGKGGISQFLKDSSDYQNDISAISYKSSEEISAYIDTLINNGNKARAKALLEYVDYVSGYEAYINNTLANADKSREFSIFTENNIYVTRNIDKIYKDYSRLTNVKPQVINASAFDNYESFVFIISAFVILVIMYCLFSSQREYDNGEILLLYSARNGRFIRAVKRNLIIILMSIGLTLVFNFVVYIVSNLLYGYVDYTALVQSSSSYAECTISMSIATACFVNVLETGIGIALVALFANLVFNGLRNRYISICLLGAFFLEEWRATLLIQNNSVNRFLANINLYRIMNYSTYYKNYANINIFGYPIASDILMFVITNVLLLLLFFMSAVVYAKRYPLSRLLFGKLRNLIEMISGRIADCCNFTAFELYKILVRQKKILIIIVLCGIEFILIYGTRVEFPVRQQYMDAVYNQYGGGDWERFDAYVASCKREIEESNREIEELRVSALNKDNAHDIIMNAESIKADIDEKEKMLREYETVKNRKSQIEADTGVTIYAMSDRGYSEIFGVNSYIREAGIMIIIIISCVLLASGYYLEEKQSGVLCILRCSDYGVKKIYLAKMRIITVVTLVLTMILVAIDMLILKKMYGFHYMRAPLISLTFMENKIPLVFMDIKIWQYMILDALTKLSIVLCALFVTLLFSLKTRSLFFVPLLMLVMAVTGTISIFAGVVVKLGIIAVMFMLSVGCIIRIYRISV